MLQNAAPLTKLAPGPPNMTNMSLVLRMPREMHLCRSSLNVPRLPTLLKLPQNRHVLFTFDKMHNPLRLPRKTTSERPKVLRTRQFLALLTSKCAARRNGVHFSIISSSKSGLRPSVFYTFSFHMCFAPQRRALFPHHNFQSAPALVCFVRLYFEMCLAPQRRAIFHFSSGQMAPHPPL